MGRRLTARRALFNLQLNLLPSTISPGNAWLSMERLFWMEGGRRSTKGGEICRPQDIGRRRATGPRNKKATACEVASNGGPRLWLSGGERDRTANLSIAN